MTLALHAAAALRSLKSQSTLEGLFHAAAFRTLAEGRLTDPPVDAVRALTQPTRVWEGVPQHVDFLRDHVARLEDATLLAIALREDAWLRDLSACWDVVGDLAGTWANGQIDLFRGGDGWHTDTLEYLHEEHMFSPGNPSGAAWLALAKGDLDGARLSYERFAEACGAVRRGWERAPAAGVGSVWSSPGMALRLPERALRATLDRRDPRRGVWR